MKTLGKIYYIRCSYMKEHLILLHKDKLTDIPVFIVKNDKFESFSNLLSNYDLIDFVEYSRTEEYRNIAEKELVRSIKDKENFVFSRLLKAKCNSL